MNRRLAGLGACLVAASTLLSACTAPSSSPTPTGAGSNAELATQVPGYYRDKGTLEVGVRAIRGVMKLRTDSWMNLLQSFST